MKILFKNTLRERRHKRVRAKIKGTVERPRLSVFRSNRHISAQLIDDTAGKTLVMVRDQEFDVGKKKIQGARVVQGGELGELLAKKAHEKKITTVVFDRGGYAYHGIIKSVADGARKGGLQF